MLKLKVIGRLMINLAGAISSAMDIRAGGDKSDIERIHLKMAASADNLGFAATPPGLLKDLFKKNHEENSFICTTSLTKPLVSV